MNDCDCTDEYGPCELHGETVIQRDGAAVRTADELSVVYVEDAVTLGAELSPWGTATLEWGRRVLDENQTHGVAWFNDEGTRDEVGTLVSQMETELYTLGYLTYWDDGFRIVQPSKDCPLTRD